MIIPLFTALAFFCGVLAAVFCDFQFASVWVFVVVLGVARKWPWLFVVFGFLAGVWRVSVYEEGRPAEIPYEQYVEIEGRVCEEIDGRIGTQKVTVMSEYGRILLTLSPYFQVEYGDVLLVKGILEKPSEDIEGFNYANYLARYRIWSVMKDPYALVAARAPPSLRGNIYKFKDFLMQRINQLLFEPEASFAAGLLLGSRKGMPEKLSDAFQAVGLTHIVAISGYNISLVIAAMFLMLGFLNLRVRVVVSTVAIVLFVVLVGASAAVVRAGIMGSLALWGLFTGRKSQAFFGLLWSAVLMVLINPYTLPFDVGFQLSFASTLGLLIFNPLFDGIFPEWKRFFALREAFILTLSAQVMTLPLIMFQFGRVSLVSVLANVLVAPFLPFAMLFSGLALLAGKSMALVAWFYLRVVELVALKMALIPFANVNMQISAGEFVVLNALILLIAISSHKSTLARALGLCPSGGFLGDRVQECGKREK
ncbi:ComEC family competence protein [Patescibacteria group bacterium]|nr:ComEC family competence protein [Patescibacteria group bacterium]